MVTEVQKREARQATTGHNVRYVLGGSLVLAIIALAIVFFVFA